MGKPLHPMTDAEAIAAYGVEPTFHESVGHAIDSGKMDRLYAEKRHGGMDHYAAKIQAYEETLGREYTYGRPGAPSARDEDLLKRLGLEQQLETERKVAEQNILNAQAASQKQVNELEGKMNRRMAYAAIAGLLTGGGIGLLLNGKESDKN